MMKQSVHLELEESGVLEAFFCPVCGTKLLGDEEEKRCPHLQYIFVDEVGEFVYTASAISDAADTVLEVEDSDEHPVELLSEKLTSKSILYLEVVMSWMACGPVSETLHLGIDFDPPEIE